MTDRTLATLGVSAGRRALGVGSLWLLAFLVLYVAVTQSPAFGWQAFLVVLGFAALFVGDLLRRATRTTLELTEDSLQDSSGEVLAHLDDVEKTDRGMFAFKPSNGFLLKTKTAGTFAWKPGVWWRLGRHIGVGGMTTASEAKAMSEIIAFKLAQRDGE